MDLSRPAVRTEGSVPEVCGERAPEPVRKQGSLTIHFTTSRAPAVTAPGTRQGRRPAAYVPWTVFGNLNFAIPN